MACPWRRWCRCWPPSSRCRCRSGIRRLTLSPQRQKQKTQEALVAWLLAEAARQPVLAVWEDLHWADPSTLELLDAAAGPSPHGPPACWC